MALSGRGNARDLLATPAGRRALFFVLYLAEGAPMGFIWWTLPAVLSKAGLDLAQITTITSAATLPWVLKFLAGPVIDATTAQRGGLRRWIVSCQLLMGLSLLPLAALDWAAATPWLTAALVTHAVMAATQDVAVDTLAMRAVPAAALGRINGWMQAGMLLGRASVAGGGLLLADRFGPAGVIGLLLLIVWAPMLVVVLATREPPPPAATAAPRRQPAWSAILSWPVLAGLWLALTGGAGFEFLGVAAGPLLLQLGAGDEAVAVFFGLLAPAALGLGALAGGRLADRLGPARVTGRAILAVAAMAAALGLLTEGQFGSRAIWLGALTCVYAGIGVLTAASYALLMRLARGRLAATRFSALMAGTNACEAWAGLLGGRLQTALGYAGALPLMAGLSLLALPALAWLQGQGTSTDGKSHQPAPSDRS